MEQTTTWLCPVCEKALNPEELIIDGFARVSRAYDHLLIDFYFEGISVAFLIKHLKASRKSRSNRMANGIPRRVVTDLKPGWILIAAESPSKRKLSNKCPQARRALNRLFSLLFHLALNSQHLYAS